MSASVPRLKRAAVIAALAGLSVLPACGPEPVTDPPLPTGNVGRTDGGSETPPTVVDLRADVNRNGIVELDVASEDLTETEWTATAGAVFLANIDDDELSCPTRTPQNGPIPDAELARCNDAADDLINGEADLEDLARMKVAPIRVDAAAVGTLTISPPAAAERVRIFRYDTDVWNIWLPGETLSAEQLEAGVELAIEAKDIVRDRAVWDGFVDVKLEVAVPGGKVFGEDAVRLRVAPVVTFHHNLAATKTYASRIVGDRDSSAFIAAMESAATAAGVSEGHQNLTTPVDDNNEWPDQWNQDFFETGYMSMPGRDGAQKVIKVAYRSANLYGSGSFPLRHAGRAVFLNLRGPDFGGIQEYSTSSNPMMDSLNSFGNTETVPPYTHDGVSFPLGRSLRGSSPSFYPDRKFTKMMEAQQVQPPIYVDTSWLYVSHVDETLSFLEADNARGWVMLANDATMAKEMLEAQESAGHGAVDLFVGKAWYDFNTGAPYSAQVSISETLGDPDIMAASAESQVEVDAQVAIMKAETGITDAEIVPVPFLHMHVDGFSIAYQPGTVNGIVFNDAHYGAPRPHGPSINGVDIFEAQLEEALGALGYTVHWIEDWDLYHALSGEVHCGSNAVREIPSALWWESGR